MDPWTLLKAALWAYLTGSIGGLVLNRFRRASVWMGFGCATLGGLLGVTSAWRTMTSAMPGPAPVVDLALLSIPYLSCTARLDALSALFILLLSLVGTAISVYSIGYTRGLAGQRANGVMAAQYNLLLLATTLVFAAENAFFFLLCWEVMALAAFCLVSFEHQHSESRRAGVLYLVMSHAGAACLVLGFLLLFHESGDYSFSGFRAAQGKLTPFVRNEAFLLFLAGFGVKAGIVPLHIWLPAAHPVAPSNISALLSGVLIKAGIYGLARVIFDLLGDAPIWWGVVVLCLGTVSALLGVLYALMEHDLKRLLAYHSIENIGIILIGFGTAMMFRHTGHSVLAALALLAGLFHTLNHALFKSLLFLGAGAVVQSTGTRNMEALGGLVQKMPRTAVFFLLGAIAISALPPLNGFVSEWLTYQALLHGFATTDQLVRLLFPISGAMLALTSALAAACFVKAFGITFLAQPRSQGAAEASETLPSMQLAQGVLACACVLLGLFPMPMIRMLDKVCEQTLGVQIAAQVSAGGGFILTSGQPNGGTVSTLGIAAAGLGLLLVPLFLRAVNARAKHVGPTWDCGLRGLTPQMEYSATGFSKPIRMIFKALFQPRREVQRDYDYSPYFAKTIRFESHVQELFEQRVYRPLHGAILRVSRRMRALQAGSIQAYLIYIFVTLLVLLVVAL